MYSNDWRVRNCPSCGSTEITPNPVAMSPHRAEMLSFEEVKSDFVGLRNAQVFFSYHRCIQCRLMYCPRYFSEEQLSILYSEMPDNLMGEDKSTVSKTQSGYVTWTARLVSSARRYLEIGPDIGLVSKEVVARFKSDFVALVEPNKSIRNLLIENSLGCEEVDIVDSLKDLKQSEFDLIAGVHVYDHLLDPLKELELLSKIASSDASLMLVVHNEKSALRKILGKKWPPFCLQHPQLYNPETLSQILERAGWRLEKVSKSTNWWHLNHLASLGLDILGLPSKWARVLPKVELPIRLGNMIALAKRF